MQQHTSLDLRHNDQYEILCAVHGGEELLIINLGCVKMADEAGKPYVRKGRTYDL